MNRVQAGLEWASFLVTRRIAIERALADRMGDAFPRASAPEAEALRRFRSFVGARLRRADASAPALDGLRVDGFATARLVDAWCAAAEDLAGSRGAELESLLAPARERFRTALLGSAAAHAARRAERPARRAVPGAIDRIADPFLAIDVDTAAVADANPAAATLFGVARVALLGRAAASLVVPNARGALAGEIEALAESAAPRRFSIELVGAAGEPLRAEVHATRVASRERLLAVLIARLD